MMMMLLTVVNLELIFKNATPRNFNYKLISVNVKIIRVKYRFTTPDGF
jgi:hypothetical protein